MKKEFNMDRIIYKITPDGDPIAFLLDIPCYGATIMSYMHVGQHGEASYEYYWECRNATPEEYKELDEEMRSIGYEPLILKRLPKDYIHESLNIDKYIKQW